MKNMRKIICGLNQRLNELSLMLEKLKLADYLQHLNNPKKIFWLNFLGGLARGFGAAVGFVLLGALVIYILEKSFLKQSAADRYDRCRYRQDRQSKARPHARE